MVKYLIGLLFVGALAAQQPNCNQTNVVFTGVTAGAQYDNRTLKCTTWQMSYYSFGFSGVSIQLESAPDNNGSPGSWTAISSSFVTNGTNPLTSTVSGSVTVTVYFPWIRVNLTTATGSGFVNYSMIGSNTLAKNGGGTGGGDTITSPGGTITVGGTPTATTLDVTTPNQFLWPFTFTNPLIPTFIWVNQGVSTVATQIDAVVMTIPQSSDVWSLQVESAPATPYSISAGFIFNLTTGTSDINNGQGLVMRESSTGKFQACGFNAGTTTTLNGTEWNSPTSFNSTIFTGGIFHAAAVEWIKLIDDGTNITCSISADGINFTVLTVTARTSFMSSGPNQVGWGAFNSNSISPAETLYIDLVSWAQGTS